MHPIIWQQFALFLGGCSRDFGGLISWGPNEHKIDFGHGFFDVLGIFHGGFQVNSQA